jgi:hypothetical protein
MHQACQSERNKESRQVIELRKRPDGYDRDSEASAIKLRHSFDLLSSRGHRETRPGWVRGLTSQADAQYAGDISERRTWLHGNKGWQREQDSYTSPESIFGRSNARG